METYGHSTSEIMVGKQALVLLALIAYAAAAPWRCFRQCDGSTVCFGQQGQPCISTPQICISRPCPPCSCPSTIYTPCQCPCPPPPCPCPCPPPPCPYPCPPPPCPCPDPCQPCPYPCPPPPCPYPCPPPPCPCPDPCPPPPCDPCGYY